jgi:hypothetical protein
MISVSTKGPMPDHIAGFRQYHGPRLRALIPGAVFAAVTVLMMCVVIDCLFDDYRSLPGTLPGTMLGAVVLGAGGLVIGFVTFEICRRLGESVELGPGTLAKYRRLPFLMTILITAGVSASHADLYQAGFACWQGRQNLSAGQPEKAAAWFSEYVEWAPRASRPLRLRADAWQQAGRLDLAIADLARAVDLQDHEWDNVPPLLDLLAEYSSPESFWRVYDITKGRDPASARVWLNQRHEDVPSRPVLVPLPVDPGSTTRRSTS